MTTTRYATTATKTLPRQPRARSLAWAALVELTNDELRMVAGGEQGDPTPEGSMSQPMADSAAKKPGDMILDF